MAEQITSVIFYTIEKSIKTYRKFAQRRIDDANINITIDQWLVLNCLNENETITQNKLAELIFKDVASVTRMVELLVKRGYLERTFNSEDRRRFDLKITDIGRQILKDVSNIVSENRTLALKGFNAETIEQLQSDLNQIIFNCER